MAIIKCLLTIVLLLFISQSLSLQDKTAVNNVYRLPKHVKPYHYDIKLIPYILEDKRNFTFDGEVNISLLVLEPTYTISLHILNLTIDESMTKLFTFKKDNQFDVYMWYDLLSFLVKQHEYNFDAQIVTIHFGVQLSNKWYQLYLKFTGSNEEDMSGFYRTFYIDDKDHKRWLATTFFQPVYTRKAFPCWDEPAIKATFQLSIKHYPNYTALSNMRSTRLKVDPIDGKLWTDFDTTPIMSINMLGFVIADYDFIPFQRGSSLKMWGPKHLLSYSSYPLDVANKTTHELERFTNCTIPTVRVSKMDHVAIPQYPVPGLASWGMIVYEQNVLFKKWSLTYIIDNGIMIVYELTHQWFGSLVSPAWWDYVWLSQGVSTYLSYYIADTVLIYNKLRFMDLFVAREVLSMMSQDSTCLTQVKTICTSININITSHKDINNAFSVNTYIKSGALLRMVSHLMGEDVFRKGLIKYLQEHKYSSVTPDDLWEALQDALDESDVKHDDFKIKEVMDTWFNQPAYPVVKIDRDYDNGIIFASQHKRVHFWNITETEENNKWLIPLNYITKSNLNSSSTLATHWLDSKGIAIEGVDKEDWIIMNKQLTGLYRVNYDETNWKRIAAFLNSNDYDKIPILNRAQIIDDVYYMMETEELDCRIFFDVIKYLRHEIDPIPWYPALRVIQSLATSYMRIPEAATIFKPYLFNLMYELFEHIGFDNKFYENPVIIDIRLKLTKFACLYNIHPECRKKATAKLLAYVKDPIANKILSDQEYLLCSGLIQANESTWHQFLLINNKLSTNVKFLGCSENSDIINKHFNILKNKYKCINLFIIMFGNLPINVDVMNIIISHYDKAAEELGRMPLLETAFHRRILNYLGIEDIDKVKGYITNRPRFLNDKHLFNRLEQLNKVYWISLILRNYN